MVSSLSVVMGLATAAWFAKEIACWWLRAAGSGVTSIAGAVGAAGAGVAVVPRRSSVARSSAARADAASAGSAGARRIAASRSRALGASA